MLGPLVEKLNVLFKRIGLNMFPDRMMEGLDIFRRIRNKLAHNYLIENSRLLTQEASHDELIKELRFFAEGFLGITKSWNKLLNIAIEKLGEGTRQEIETQYGTIMDEAQIALLKERIQTYRLDD